MTENPAGTKRATFHPTDWPKDRGSPILSEADRRAMAVALPGRLRIFA